jgi:hypothetical protein
LYGPGDGNRHIGDEREVDDAPQRHDQHARAQNAEHRHAADQRENVAGLKKFRQDHGEGREQEDRQDKDDLFLVEWSKYAELRLYVLSFPSQRRTTGEPRGEPISTMEAGARLGRHCFELSAIARNYSFGSP